MNPEPRRGARADRRGAGAPAIGGPGALRRVHPYAWLWEPLESEPSFLLRPMFGTRAAYLDGRLVLCFSAGDEPWRGVLVCTEKAHHGSLMAEIPALAPHPVLPKWLYLPDSFDAFDRRAEQLVALVRRRDPRIGVAPGERRRGRAQGARGAPGRAAGPSGQRGP